MERYYVYRHFDPETNETVYVGLGQNHRAWSSTVSGGFRKDHHVHWILEQESKGYLMGDLVEILHRGLGKEDARTIEKEYILLNKPKFNIFKGEGSLVDKEKVKSARDLRKTGISYDKIADKMGLKSAMTAWRYVNGY